VLYVQHHRLLKTLPVSDEETSLKMKTRLNGFRTHLKMRPSVQRPTTLINALDQKVVPAQGSRELTVLYHILVIMFIRVSHSLLSSSSPISLLNLFHFLQFTYEAFKLHFNLFMAHFHTLHYDLSLLVFFFLFNFILHIILHIAIHFVSLLNLFRARITLFRFSCNIYIFTSVIPISFTRAPLLLLLL
jgi:hypothetical protein